MAWNTGVWLAGCAMNPPRGLEAMPPGAPSPAEVRADPSRHLGQQVRWGGEILGLDNLAGATEVEIFSRPLFNNAEPRPDGGEGVRFIARVPGFLDPAQYRVDKRMTVAGRVTEPVTRPVGEYPYLYLAAEDGFDRVPQALLERFGEPRLVLELELNPQRRLAREDVNRVMTNLRERGYHLQMPPDLRPDLYHGNAD
jgi:uncharacterized protein YcgL (UPF0745 family)